MKNVRCAKCTKCGREYEALPGITTCACGGILDIEYHYDYIKMCIRDSLRPVEWHVMPLVGST